MPKSMKKSFVPMTLGQSAELTKLRIDAFGGGKRSKAEAAYLLSHKEAYKRVLRATENEFLKKAGFKASVSPLPELPSWAGKPYELVVDFGISNEDLAEIIKLAGPNDLNSKLLSDPNFRMPSELVGLGKRRIAVYAPDIRGSWSSEKGKSTIDELGLQQGNVPVMALFAKAFPDVQRSIWFVGLGEETTDPFGRRLVPVLGGLSSSRFFGLNFWADAWRSDFRPFGWLDLGPAE